MIENTIPEYYTNKEEYEQDVKKRSALPEGFKTSSVPLKFFPVEKQLETPLNMNLTMILLDEPTVSFGGMFTKNCFPGAPVIIGRELLKKKKASGVIINNKISNVCAPNGVESSMVVMKAAAAAVGADDDVIFPSSTGIIGWSLPVKDMCAKMPELALGLHNSSIYDAAAAIMTTDSFPKVRSVKIGDGTIVAIGKGAGMIEPNLATMLVYILTDIKISRKDLRSSLKSAVSNSFNRISIDSDQSTSDTVLIFSSNKKKSVNKKLFCEKLSEVCTLLAQDIVRNGEGTSHVMKVSVTNCFTDDIAARAGKAIVNSPLLKTAVYGNDPNVGRLIASLGDFFGNMDIPADKNRMTIKIGGRTVFSNGAFKLDAEAEDFLFNYFKKASLPPEKTGFPAHNLFVDIDVDAGLGKGNSVVYGSDLSYEYVRENADYRS